MVSCAISLLTCSAVPSQDPCQGFTVASGSDSGDVAYIRNTVNSLGYEDVRKYCNDLFGAALPLVKNVSQGKALCAFLADQSLEVYLGITQQKKSNSQPGLYWVYAGTEIPAVIPWAPSQPDDGDGNENGAENDALLLCPGGLIDDITAHATTNVIVCELPCK